MHRYRAAVHGGLFLALLIGLNAAFSFGWPWYLFFPIFVYGAIVAAVTPLRQTAPVLIVGRIDTIPLLASVVLIAVTAGVLVGFQALVRPDVTGLGLRIPVNWLGNLLLAGLCFSVVNALAEEVIFRGILWEVVAEEWNKWTALGVTSILFGTAHVDGYPPGPTGVVLAGLYGVTLGAMRLWVGGLGLPIACHVCADATIFGILLAEDAFD